ncbi:hypothetical protein AMTR_s00017p00238420 [Amborella trichopoda]|uniref:Uncharacterized protein n=1 Tax=Amborella trichopoda TaxID=13333 RepID=W1PFH4_AMBTC|nr:hypothetical protein AMTR_s00017p00238420 [Amborella trichopoda]
MASYRLPAILLILAVLTAASVAPAAHANSECFSALWDKADASRRSTTSIPLARTFLGWIAARKFWKWDHNAGSHFGFLVASALISSPSSTLIALCSSRARARGLRLHPESLSRQKPLENAPPKCPKNGGM